MIKYTVKLQLWEHETNAKNLHPIYLKITINRETRYISTGHYIRSGVWDAKNELIKEGHPLASTYNSDITSRKQQVIKKIVEYQMAGKHVTAGQLKELFSRVDHHNDLFSFAEKFIKEVAGKREAGTLENYRKHLEKLKLFHGSDRLAFEDITPEFLLRYETYLRETVGGNYIHALFKTLKSFFNAAIKRKVITYYPFTSYDNPVYKSPVKDFLTQSELTRWEKETDLIKDKTDKQAAVYFLLGCYSGLRISDWFQFDINKNIVDGRLIIQATKNQEQISMVLNAGMKRNLKRMKVLPLTIAEPVINRSLKEVAKKAKIHKRITTHSGRHTFAVTICLHNGISSETAAKLMGITLATFVDNYSQVTQQKIDKETLEAWKDV